MKKSTSRLIASLIAVAALAGFQSELLAQNSGLDSVLNAAEAKRDLRDQQKALFDQLLA